jgi:hypothetical protein
MALTEREKQIIEMAKDQWEGSGHHSDGDVNIEELPEEDGAPYHAIVSESDDTFENVANGNGAYVLGWLWVSFYGTPLDKMRHAKTADPDKELDELLRSREPRTEPLQPRGG